MEHFTENTESILKWCGKCGRQTRHAVSGGRAGRCTEHEAAPESQAQRRRRLKAEREAANPTLFDLHNNI
jgi:hypothetical protein